MAEEVASPSKKTLYGDDFSANTSHSAGPTDNRRDPSRPDPSYHLGPSNGPKPAQSVGIGGAAAGFPINSDLSRKGPYMAEPVFNQSSRGPGAGLIALCIAAGLLVGAGVMTPFVVSWRNSA